ncbi:hypothetical protein EDB19DRAFT_264362 [Suillus lakei]|nr:hypothetical protein EDB19DRAFT_264362 [Suillus lakei]
MQGLGNSAKRTSYIRVLIRCMGPTRRPRVRHAALRAVSDARGELASITNDSMPQGVDAQLLDELSRALFSAVRPNDDRDSGPDASFRKNRDEHYISLVFALTTNDEWCQRLIRDGHGKRCISLIDDVCRRVSWCLGSYLVVIFGRIDPSGRPIVARDTWRLLIVHTWDGYLRHGVEHDDYVNAISALVTATWPSLLDSDNDVPREWLVDLIQKVHGVLVGLPVQNKAPPIRKGQPRSLADAALSSAQGLYDDLSRMIEHTNTPQRENGSWKEIHV